MGHMTTCYFTRCKTFNLLPADTLQLIYAAGALTFYTALHTTDAAASAAIMEAVTVLAAYDRQSDPAVVQEPRVDSVHTLEDAFQKMCELFGLPFEHVYRRMFFAGARDLYSAIVHDNDDRILVQELNTTLERLG